MTKGFIPALICAGLVLPLLTACQTDRSAYTSLRDDSVVRDQAREREIQLQLATSRDH
jgi:hypothetical protein